MNDSRSHSKSLEEKNINGDLTSLKEPIPELIQTSPILDETLRVGPDYVLAMYDYVPHPHQKAACLAFQAGQVIQVLNRDTSGWWDGELAGRRGWFPSNYVNAMDSPTEEPPETDIDPHYPPLMIPLRHGLSLLQSAVRANRISDFQPSAASIISCVRSILSATETLPREAPVLQRFPVLSQERKKTLAVLASLVAQAKKASEQAGDKENQEVEVESMLRLGGQVFVHVRNFLEVAVQCGVELPERRQSNGSLGGSTDTERQTWNNGDESLDTPSVHYGQNGGNYTRKPNTMSISSTSSSSSISSLESTGSPNRPPFPRGPSSTIQVMEALRYTHDHYLSTTAALIGLAHSHSRSSHASSTSHIYDSVREIFEIVSKLLTIVEAVMRHPDVPSHKLGNLQSAKEDLYDVTSSLAESVRRFTLSLPPTMSEEEEKQNLLRSATGGLKAGTDCVAAVKICLNQSVGERPFIIHLPVDGESGPKVFARSKF